MQISNQISNHEKFEIMQEGGKIAAYVLNEAMKRVAPGVTTFDLDKFIESAILTRDATPAFKGYRGYKYASCINLNDGLVHGIPRASEIIKEGDLVTIDLGVKFRGYINDCAWTKEAGKSNFHRDFLKVGKNALKKAISEVKSGNDVLDISRVMQEVIEKGGYNAVRDLTGHGVGSRLHEGPMIPCYYDPLYLAESGKMKEGMGLAIEVMYTEGAFDLISDRDGWTIRTKDGKISALFEETVFVSPNGPIVLTKIDE